MIPEDLVLSLDPPDPYAFSSIWFALGAMAGAIVGIVFMLIVEQIAGKPTKRERIMLALSPMIQKGEIRFPEHRDGLLRDAMKAVNATPVLDVPCSRVSDPARICSCSSCVELEREDGAAAFRGGGAMKAQLEAVARFYDARPHIQAVDPDRDSSTDNVKRTDILP